MSKFSVNNSRFLINIKQLGRQDEDILYLYIGRQMTSYIVL